MAIPVSHRIADDWGVWLGEGEELTAEELAYAQECSKGCMHFRDAFVRYHEHPDEDHPEGVGMLRCIPYWVFVIIWGNVTTLSRNRPR